MVKPLILKTSIMIALVLTISWAAPSFAQQPTPAPGQTTPTPAVTPASDDSSLEHRVVKLEAEQSQTIEALKITNERNTSLFTITSGLLGLLILIQGVVTFIQQRRDSKRDGAELVGVKRVNEIMTVVRDSFESRLTAEKEERERREKAEERLASFDKQIQELNASSARQKRNLEKKHQTIEELAFELSKIGRHQFKSKTVQLEKFANNFDQFDSFFLPIEEDVPTFSLHTHFIRGVAAHYGNEPSIALEHLKKVVSTPRSENEDDVSRNRILASAYYYIGLIHSNFGNTLEAIAFFDQGNALMSPHIDFFTQIVTAEAYVFNFEFSKAEQLLDEVIKGLDTEEKVEGHNYGYLSGDRNRATLIKANMAIMLHEPKWQERVQQLLDPLYRKDSSFYFAGITLAQTYDSQGKKELADEYFRKSYRPIQITSIAQSEVRSQILFLMTAGMAAKYISDESESKIYLDQASNLVGVLPKLENQTCTVYSTLNKRNVSSDEIKEHIELIRQGRVLLNHDK